MNETAFTPESRVAMRAGQAWLILAALVACALTIGTWAVQDARWKERIELEVKALKERGDCPCGPTKQQYPGQPDR